VPEIKISGHLEATFPYIQSHLEYIVGELLRNSILAVMERNRGSSLKPSPIEVLICEAPQHVVIRISDQGGGIPRDMLPYLWSFNKGPRNAARLHNLEQVPKMAAIVNELQGLSPYQGVCGNHALLERPRDSSLSSLSLQGRQTCAWAWGCPAFAN
jgi:pyruvate dehydrogenase kinase 2/3/4